MAKLAIKGHETRGKEVIEILEMLEGKNIHNYGGERDIWYVVTYNTIEMTTYLFEEKGFTLEEFLEKFPYKVGDKVHTPGYESEVRIEEMKWNGFEIQYSVFTDEIEWYSSHELKECNADFLINKKCGEIPDNIAFMHSDKEGEKKTLLTSLIEYFKMTPKDELEREWNEHKELDEIGPTVEEYIAFAESFKKQPKYPQTYCECCDILGYKSSYDLNNIATHDCVYDHKLQMFYRVLICRDAYWKIAGEQMGLGKPWKPDSIEMYHAIVCRDDGSFLLHRRTRGILIFPTAEMRDAFYENFKDLIESCKDLL